MLRSTLLIILRSMFVNLCGKFEFDIFSGDFGVRTFSVNISEYYLEIADNNKMKIFLLSFSSALC